jgi:transposase
LDVDGGNPKLEAKELNWRRASAIIAMADRSILAWHRKNEVSKRLETIPSIGIIAATTVVTDAGVFASGLRFAALIGLKPRLTGTGGKTQLGRSAKAGDRDLRRLPVLGATSLVRYARANRSRRHGSPDCWRGVPFGW